MENVVLYALSLVTLELIAAGAVHVIRARLANTEAAVALATTVPRFVPIYNWISRICWHVHLLTTPSSSAHISTGKMEQCNGCNLG